MNCDVRHAGDSSPEFYGATAYLWLFSCCGTALHRDRLDIVAVLGGKDLWQVLDEEAGLR